MSESSFIDYLCIGHCCHDLGKDQIYLGGTASYSSLVAQRLGKLPAVLTSVGPEFGFRGRFEELNIPFFNKPAKETTVFQNTYRKVGRLQHLLARAETLSEEDVSDALIATPIIHLCPIADEIDFSIVNKFSNSLIGGSIQGMLRKWDEKNIVTVKAMDWQKLALLDVVILSEEDIRGSASFLEKIVDHSRQVVLTMGTEGARIIDSGKEQFFPSFPVAEIEATGAGDVFSAAYLIEYQRSSDILNSCIFAHCAASFVVEGWGLEKIPSTSHIEERVIEYKRLFGH